MRRLGGPLGVWRLGVLLLAAGFWAQQFALQDLADFGWQFRYFAVWALTLGLAAGALTFRLSLVPDAGAPNSLLLVAAAVSALQAVLFWFFRLSDPSAIGAGGAGGDPVRIVYLHVLMPAFIWLEAVVFNRTARAAPAAACWLLMTLAAYVLWIEGAVVPLNPVPAGAVTSGMPYPFLNDMTQGARAALYAKASIVGVGLIGLVHWAAVWADGYSSSASSRAASPSR